MDFVLGNRPNTGGTKSRNGALLAISDGSGAWTGYATNNDCYGYGPPDYPLECPEAHQPPQLTVENAPAGHDDGLAIDMVMLSPTKCAPKPLHFLCVLL